ncbi:MAG: hypothetical protein ABIJ97_17620 [Bacteroidota bacterium]
MKSISRIFLICIVPLLSFNADMTEKKSITFKDAIDKNLIKTIVTGLGGHQGNCVEIEVRNISSYDTTFCFEPGRRLVSEDSTVQDILIVKENSFFLASGKNIVISGYGFCCQAHNSSPRKSEIFKIGDLADDNMVKLAEYLNKNDYPDDAMQGAVWVLSDNKPLDCINSTDENVDKVRKLQKFVATLAKIDINLAWYSIVYKTDTSMLFSGIADTLVGEVEYQLWNNCEASLVMYDNNGKIIHHFYKNKLLGPDKYIYPVKFSVFDWPKGKYFIRLFADGQMKKENVFEL